MGVDAALPPGLWERVRQIAREEVAKVLRSGLLRNASISDGGLTIKGGFLRLLSAVSGGAYTFYVGPVTPSLPDGTPQPGMFMQRNDGTIALALYDPNPAAGDYNQFLGWFDRTGHAIVTDDTDSGQGLARPYLSEAFYPSRAGDFLKSTAGTWETIWRARISKQHPKLYVEAWTYADTAGTTGQVQVTVNGTVWGSPQPAVNTIVGLMQWGPAPVDGSFGDTLSVEIQAQRTAGTGSIAVGASWVQGRQS